MDNFSEYLYHLLPSPLKVIGKKANHWWTFCSVLGKRYDALKRLILDVREYTMIMTCPPELLPIIGQERNMPRLDGENIEQYRIRLTYKNIIAERAGTAEGIVALVKSLGYDRVTLEPAYLTNPDKWAEATVWISGGNLALDNRDILQQEINNIKQASALVTLAHEQIYSGAIYCASFTEITKIIDVRQV